MYLNKEVIIIKIFYIIKLIIFEINYFFFVNELFIHGKLNIIYFTFDSHMNVYTEGVYNLFKSNLYIKVASNKKLL